jgi:hypothetical protein
MRRQQGNAIHRSLSRHVHHPICVTVQVLGVTCARRVTTVDLAPCSGQLLQIKYKLRHTFYYCYWSLRRVTIRDVPRSSVPEVSGTLEVDHGNVKHISEFHD